MALVALGLLGARSASASFVRSLFHVDSLTSINLNFFRYFVQFLKKLYRRSLPAWGVAYRLHVLICCIAVRQALPPMTWGVSTPAHVKVLDLGRSFVRRLHDHLDRSANTSSGLQSAGHVVKLMGMGGLQFPHLLS